MKRYLITFLKWTGLLILIPVALFLLLQTWFYLTAPVYRFASPQPFRGTQWYNPYAGMDSACWRKANFHFHTREWGGVTAGKGNSNEEFRHVYGQLGYDAPMISNYMRISEFNRDSAFWTGVYEHGYGVWKKHQIVIGAREVLWRDYSFYQNLHHRQHIIDLLKQQGDLVALAHPGWDDGYPADRIGILSNYDLIEAVNGNYRSIPQWDSALSAGRPVYILADDDSHDVTDPGEIGICISFINAPENSSRTLIDALKAGRAFGADVFREPTETWEEKILYHASGLPEVRAVEMTGDTLQVRVSKQALKIEFIGQGGVVRKEVLNDSTAWYLPGPEDTYLRTQITFPNPKGEPGTKFYLNPVFRYDGTPPVNRLTAEINAERTWIFRILSFGSLALIVVVAIKIVLSRRKRKNSR